MRHIVQCVSISTNVLTSISSALDREMKTHCSMSVYFFEKDLREFPQDLERKIRRIVQCASISTNALTALSFSIGERNETHCSMCVYFYECAYVHLVSIGERNKTHFSM